MSVSTFWVSWNLWYEFQRIFLPRAKEDADKSPYYLSLSLGRIFSLALHFSEDLSPGFMPGLNFNSSLYDSPQFSSAAQLCPTLCDPMNRSSPGLAVHHQLPEFTQTHAHQISDAIQPFHSLSPPSPAFSLLLLLLSCFSRVRLCATP